MRNQVIDVGGGNYICGFLVRLLSLPFDIIIPHSSFAIPKVL